jgi:hypothetical protein
MKKRALVLALLLFAASAGAKAAPFDLHAQTGNIDQSIGTNVALAAAIPPAATCTGPCVSLSWTASTTTGAQYNILRGTTAGGESATPINATPLAAGTTSYNDTTVIGGTTYFYAAVALCVSGGGCPAGVIGTSARSNEVSVTEPTSLPQPPANLTGTAQ